jgi:hypothetical protein
MTGLGRGARELEGDLGGGNNRSVNVNALEGRRTLDGNSNTHLASSADDEKLGHDL